MSKRLQPAPTRSGERSASPKTDLDPTGHDDREHAESKRLNEERTKALLAVEQQADERTKNLLRSARAWGAPLSSYSITATFGASGAMWAAGHTGLDLAAPSGTPIVAVGPGEVVFAGWDGPYGNKVELRHPDGTVTWYAHMTSIEAQVGQTVSAGDPIGSVGATGNVTGPHLHLEARPGGGDPTDPRTLLSQHGVTL